MEVTADGENMSKVLEGAKPSWVYRQRLVVTRGLIDGEGNRLTPCVVQRFPSRRRLLYVPSLSFAHGLP